MSFRRQDFYVGYINLERSTDRRDRMERQLAAHGLAAERIVAIDGGAHSFNIEDTAYRPHRRRWIGASISASEIAVVESHRRALAAFLASGREYGIVLEDDAKLAASFAETVNRVVRDTDGWDVVRLMWRKRGTLGSAFVPLGARGRLVFPRNMTLCAVGMLYSRRGAERALESFEKGYIHTFDHHLGLIHKTRLVFMQLDPPIVSEAGFTSVIGHHFVDGVKQNRAGSQRNRLQAMLYRIQRAWAGLRRRMLVHTHERQVGSRPRHIDLVVADINASQQGDTCRTP